MSILQQQNWCGVWKEKIFKVEKLNQVQKLGLEFTNGHT